MKILVIGGLGSIGERYCAILKHLGIPYLVFDPAKTETSVFPDWRSFDKAIIASPTYLHFDHCQSLILRDKEFLCEKPLSKKPTDCDLLAKFTNGYVVNNYAYLTKLVAKEKPELAYNYFRTGHDGLWWDVCQILYLDPMAKIETTSPIWTFTINHAPVSYRMLEESYLWMVQDFVDGNKKGLWTLKDGERMTRITLGRIALEKRDPHTSKIRVKAVSA